MKKIISKKCPGCGKKLTTSDFQEGIKNYHSEICTCGYDNTREIILYTIEETAIIDGACYVEAREKENSYNTILILWKKIKPSKLYNNRFVLTGWTTLPLRGATVVLSIK